MSEIGELLGVEPDEVYTPDAAGVDFGAWMESVVKWTTKTGGTVYVFDGATNLFPAPVNRSDSPVLYGADAERAIAERGALLPRWWEGDE